MSASVELDHPLGFVRDGQVFRKAQGQMAEVQIGQVIDTPQAAIDYFLDRFSIAERWVAELEESVAAAENKGSYLMKLLHLRDKLQAFNALGDFPALLVRLEHLEGQLRETVHHNRERNLKTKAELLAELRAAAGAPDWSLQAAQVRQIQQRWLRVGRAAEGEETDLETEFGQEAEAFFARLADFREARNAMYEERLVSYRDLIDKSEALKQHADPQRAVVELRALHETWKQVGKIPHRMAQDLWTTFKASSDVIFERARQAAGPNQKEALYSKNLALRTALIEQAEAQAEQQEIDLEVVKTLQKEWQQMGPVSPQDRRELNERFHTACDLAFERHYIQRTIARRFPKFEDVDRAEQLRIRRIVLKDLIARDQEELRLFRENAEKFQVGDESAEVQRTLDTKLRYQERKLEAKRLLLEQVEQVAN